MWELVISEFSPVGGAAGVLASLHLNRFLLWFEDNTSKLSDILYMLGSWIPKPNKPQILSSASLNIKSAKDRMLYPGSCVFTNSLISPLHEDLISRNAQRGLEEPADEGPKQLHS